MYNSFSLVHTNGVSIEKEGITVKKGVKPFLNVAAACVMATTLVAGCGTANQPDNNMSPTGPGVNNVGPNNNTWNNDANQGTRLPGTDHVPGVNNVGPNNGLNDGTNRGTRAPGAGAGVNNGSPNNQLNDGVGGRYRNEQAN